MTDIKRVALAASSVAAFTEAMRGPKGTLDAWLEDNNEAEVRAHVEAYAEQAIDSLRAEVGRWKSNYNEAIELKGRAFAESNRLAAALRELVEVFSASGMYDAEVFDNARAALRDHDQEGKDG